MFDHLVDAVLIFGFPLGVLVGYMWRARISHARRDRYLAEKNSAARDSVKRSRGPPVMEKSAPTLAPIASDLGVEIPHQAEVAKDGVSQPRKKRAKAARKPKAPKAAPS